MTRFIFIVLLLCCIVVKWCNASPALPDADKEEFERQHELKREPSVESKMAYKEQEGNEEEANNQEEMNPIVFSVEELEQLHKAGKETQLRTLIQKNFERVAANQRDDYSQEAADAYMEELVSRYNAMDDDQRAQRLKRLWTFESRQTKRIKFSRDWQKNGMRDLRLESTNAKIDVLNERLRHPAAHPADKQIYVDKLSKLKSMHDGIARVPTGAPSTIKDEL
jgi:hypothetical protein